jgi:hypothetical protein
MVSSAGFLFFITLVHALRDQSRQFEDGPNQSFSVGTWNLDAAGGSRRRPSSF